MRSEQEFVNQNRQAVPAKKYWRMPDDFSFDFKGSGGHHIPESGKSRNFKLKILWLMEDFGGKSIAVLVCSTTQSKDQRRVSGINGCLF